jgi:hypothetical protein
MRAVLICYYCGLLLCLPIARAQCPADHYGGVCVEDTSYYAEFDRASPLYSGPHANPSTSCQNFKPGRPSGFNSRCVEYAVCEPCCEACANQCPGRLGLGACKPCPAGTTAPAGSTVVAQCVPPPPPPPPERPEAPERADSGADGALVGLCVAFGALFVLMVAGARAASK